MIVPGSLVRSDRDDSSPYVSLLAAPGYGASLVSYVGKLDGTQVALVVALVNGWTLLYVDGVFGWTSFSKELRVLSPVEGLRP